MEFQTCHTTPIMHKDNKNSIVCQRLAKTEQRIPLHRLSQLIQLLSWRKRYETHIIGYQWTSIEPFNEQEVTMHLKQSQKLVSLKNIQLVRNTDIIKNVSKIFKGFKILYDKFGPFELSPQMIAFDETYDPFVWMNKSYWKNQYKRDYISEEEFAQNILQILLKNQDKFDNSYFVSYCSIARTNNYKLAQMAVYFQNKSFEQLEKERSLIQETVSQKSIGLTFNKNKKTKKNIRRGSACINHSVSSLGLCQLSRDLTDFHKNITTRNEQVLSNDSTTNPFSKAASKIISLSSEKILDQSFSFQGQEDSGLKKVYCDLSVSVDIQGKDQSLNKSIIVLPMLDRLQACMVNSIINPSID